MPDPGFWPNAANFKSFHDVFHPTNPDQDTQLIQGFNGSVSAMAKALNDHNNNSNHFTMAQLTNGPEYTDIRHEIQNGLAHAAGYKQDKYAPAQLIKRTAAAPGATWSKKFWEWLGGKRLSVQPGDWDVSKVFVCKNPGRWAKFEAARQHLDNAGVDVTADFNAANFQATGFSGNKIQKTWAKGPNSVNFPVVDAKYGECWLWSGQPFDIYHGILNNGFQRLHCSSNAQTGFGALGRGNYFTDKFAKALLYALNLRNEYPGKAKGSDFRVLMLSRVLLGRVKTIDDGTSVQKTGVRFGHNLELTSDVKDLQKFDQISGTKVAANDDQDYRTQKLARAPRVKGWNNNYQITGTSDNANFAFDSIHTQHKGSNEFVVASGKQIYPEFLVFVRHN